MNGYVNKHKFTQLPVYVLLKFFAKKSNECSFMEI